MACHVHLNLCFLALAQTRFGEYLNLACPAITGLKIPGNDPDQDNAIVYTDPEAGSDQEVKNYFHNLAQRVVSGLEICGFPLCKGNIMASNPNWCQPQTVWRRYFAEWITEASPEDLRNCSIFFDFRPLAGASSLAQKLRIFLNDCVEAFNVIRDLQGELKAGFPESI